jgi:hypothetical protein
MHSGVFTLPIQTVSGSRVLAQLLSHISQRRMAHASLAAVSQTCRIVFAAASEFHLSPFFV